MSRDLRLAPSSHRRALILLIPFVLLGTALLGLLAQSADAADPVQQPTLTSGPTPGPSSVSWTYTVPSGGTTAPVAVTSPATGTVGISTTTTSECAFTRVLPAPESQYTTGAGCHGAAGSELSFTGSPTTDGTYFLSVRTVELEETTFTPEGSTEGTTTASTYRSEAVTSSFLYDGNAPVVTVTGPAAGTTRTPTFAIGLVDGTASTVTCTVNGASQACSVGAPGAALDLTGMPDGDYVLAVTAVDAGNRSTTTSVTYVLDAFTIGAAGPTAGRTSTPAWTYTGSTATGSTCNIVGPGSPTVSCGATGLAATLPLTPTTGTTYQVEATVSDGVNSQVLPLTYVLDNVVQLTIQTPTNPSSSTTPRWTFMTGEAVTVSSCVLTVDDLVVSDTGVCSSTGYQAGGLTGASGTEYVLTVTATDSRGNELILPSSAYVLDTTPATLVLTPAQLPVDDVKTPSWTFSGDTFTNVACTLMRGTDTVADGTCRSTGYTAPDLSAAPDATYTLTVTGQDAAGNAVSASVTYTFDTAAPSVSASSPAARSNDPRPVFTFSATGASSVTCSLSTGAGPDVAGLCTFNATTGAGSFQPTGPLAGGAAVAYTFVVTAKDDAGNTTTSAPVGYVLDTVAPAATALSPAVTGKDQSPTFTFTFEGGAKTVTCALVGEVSGTRTTTCDADLAGGTGSSTPATDLPTSSGETWTFRVTVTDTAGNSTQSAPVTYLLDTTAPTATASSPAARSNDQRPTFTFSTSGASSVTCSLSTGAGPSVAGLCTLDATTGTGSFRPADPLPGGAGISYTFVVTARDLAGNSTPSAPVSYVLDTLAPSAVATSPAVTGTDTRPTFTFAFEGGAQTVTCALIGTLSGTRTTTCTGDLAAGTGSFRPTTDLPGTSGETWTFTITVTDTAGNSTQSAPVTYTLDTAAPSVSASSPAARSNDPRPVFTFSATGASSVTCSLSTGAGPDVAGLCTFNATTGAGSFQPTGPLAGGAAVAYTFVVTAKDDAGNTTTSAPVGYVLDTVAPAATALSPAVTGKDQSPTFTFTFEGGAKTVTCALVGEVSGTRTTTCDADLAGGTGSSTPATDLPTSSGETWTFRVTVTDTAGNSTQSAPVTYLLDTTAPTATATSPAARSNVTSPTFTFVFGPDVAAVQCSLVGTASGTRAGSCAFDLTAGTGSFTPTAALPGAAGETYTFTVTVTDAAGNATPATVTYVLDTSPPAAAVTSPAVTGKDTTPTFGFSFEPGARTVTCALVGAVSGTRTTACTADLAAGSGSFTPASDLPLTDGETWTFTVTVTDTAGNATTSPAVTYLLDTTLPTASAVSPAVRGNDTTPTFTFAFEPGAATVGCVLTGTASGPRAGTCSYDLTAGTGSFTPTADLPGSASEGYAFTVTVTDAAGNQVSASASYLLDSTPPAAAAVSPAVTSNDRSPTFSFTFEPGAASVTCALVGPDSGTRTSGCSVDLAAGTGSFTPADLPATDGELWTFTITVRDVAGNTATSTPVTYRLDTSAPAVAALSPAVEDDERTPTFTFTFEGGARTVSCSLVDSAGTAVGGTCASDLAGGTGSFSPTSPLPGTTGETYAFTVAVTDQAGNPASAAATYRLDSIAELAPGTAPVSPGRDTTPTWTFSSEAGPGVTVTCRLSTAAGVVSDGPCTTAGSFTPATDLPATSGTTYTLVVTVVDALGNRSALTLPTYVLDTVADLTPGTAPVSPGRDTTPTWTFSSEAGPGVTVTCRLSTAAGVVSDGPCTTAGSFTPATDLPATSGTTYTLVVTVVDALGNRSALTLPTYVLDTVADLTPGTAPVSPGRDTTPTWTFSSEAGPGVTVTCRLSTAAGVVSDGPCTTAGSFTPATDLPATSGTTYTLVVTVVDALGNRSALTLPTYVLDTVADLTPGTAPVSPGRDTTPTWTFTLETGSTASCSLAGPGAPVGGIDCSAGTFTSPALPDTAGDDYVLTITVTDVLGNATDYLQPVVRLDTRLPVATVTTPASPSRETSVTWTVAADEPLTSATCSLRRDGVIVQTLTDCPGSPTVALPGDGRYDLVVTLVDLAGNSSTTTSTVLVHDATTPTAPRLSPTQTTTNRTTATWTVTGEGGTSITTCRVTRDGAVVQDWTVCSGMFSVPLPVDGTYLLEAVSTDPAGAGPVSTATYLLDTVLPVAPTVSGPTGPSQSRSPSWTVGSEPGTTTECRLVRGGSVVSDWAPCGAGFAATLDGLPDGGYVLESRATDAAQNVGPTGSSVAYVLDTTAPVAPVVAGPTGPSQLRNPRFTWTGEPGTTAECQLLLDGAPVGGWVACGSGFAPTLDRDGTWTLTVRLSDAARNVSDAATTGGYVLDTTPPDAPVVTPPKTPGRDLAPSWGAVVEAGTSLECRLTGADGVIAEWAACTLPVTTSLAGRPDGTYVLEVRATDVAGNRSPVGTGTYVLDTVAPAAAVVTSPPGGRSRAPVFTFTVEPGATTRCRLTSGTTVISDFAACSSPVPLDLTGLPDGTYALTVRVLDVAGNPGPAATGTYVLDTTGPAAPVLTLSPASPSPARSVTWAFSFEPGSTLVCRLTFPTGAVRELTGCASPLVVDLTGLPDGTYTLTVRAVDAVGNVGAVLTEAHVLDSATVAPPTLTGPVTPGSSRTPRWTTSGTSTECRLTRGSTVLRDWVACAGGFTADLFGQPDGTYVLSARSKDATGALSGTVQSRYVLDTTTPGAATVVAPPTPSTNRMPTWTIASSELGATAECRVLVFGSVLRDWARCAVTPGGALYAVDLTGLGDGTYTLVVRLTDAAGNRSTVEASAAYVLDTSAPVAVGITGPPSPGNDRTPTWTLSSGAGAVLECRLTSAAGVVSDWAVCTGQYVADLTGLPDGIYTLAVRALSAAGTPGPDTTSAYELNVAAPSAPAALALVSGIKPIDNNPSPTWTFTLPTGTTGVCRVVQGTRVVFDGPCSSPFRLDLSGQRDGGYTLTVRGVSAAGSPGAAATSTYVYDTEPTAVPVFTQVPGATGSTLDPQWRFSVTRGASAQCRLSYGGAPLDDWAVCLVDAPFTAQLTGRPDGTYLLQVRAVDAAGNTSAPVSSQYVLDRTAAPVPTFSTTPPATSNDLSVAWSFLAPGGTTLECRMVSPDGSATAWGSCGPAPLALRPAGGSYALDLTGRADGLYLLEVRAVEADGRRGSASSSGYRLDTRAPDMPSYSDVPEVTGSDPKPVWLWDIGSDELVECRLVRVGGGAVTDWQECAASQYEVDLSRLGDGQYALELRVTDAAGNASAPRSAAYRYDRTPPASAVVTSRPPSSGSDRTVSWTFGPVDGRASCSITRDRTLIREGACNGRFDLDLGGLPDGAYTLTIRVTDAAGNASGPTTSSYALRTVGLAGPVRVDAPPLPRPVEPVPDDRTPTGPGRGGTGIVVTPPFQGSSSGPGVPIQPAEDDIVRASEVGPTTSAPDAEEAAGPQPEPKPSGQSNPLLPRALPVEDVPEVLRELVTGNVTKPTLPLALLAIVILFLLAQNRIDRRDPKLAAAPVEAEPELDFTAYVHRPGSALS